MERKGGARWDDEQSKVGEPSKHKGRSRTGFPVSELYLILSPYLWLTLISYGKVL